MSTPTPSIPTTAMATRGPTHAPTTGGKKGRKSHKKRGGSGAADYATAVYGNSESQHAQSDSNVIHANQVRSGGRAKGGNVLNDIAVPAVLLYANHAYGKGRNQFPMRKTFRRKGRKANRRRTFRRRR